MRFIGADGRKTGKTAERSLFGQSSHPDLYVRPG
jgi:hypothetical protein